MVLCAKTAVFAKSGLLSILATLAFLAAVGATTVYGHATYALVIQQSAVIAVLFSIWTWVMYSLSKRLPPDYERIAIAFSRSLLFLVKLGFGVGSLSGDDLWNQGVRSAAIIPDRV